MLLPKIVNSAGLLLGIAGSLLIWKFGLPADINRSGAVHRITEGIDESEVALGKKYDRWAKVGLLFLAIGFGLQLLSNFL
jgi:hypothetical protein